MDTYKINIEGLDRELRKFPVNDKLDIAAFIMFGDIEMTEVAARELLKRVPEHDVVVTAEAKGVFRFAMKWLVRAAETMLLQEKALRFIWVNLSE